MKSVAFKNGVFWWLMILSLVLSLGLLAYNGRLNRLENPTTMPIMASIDVEQGLLSKGWVMECSEFANVSKYQFVDEVNHNCDVQCQTIEGCRALYGSLSNYCSRDFCESNCPLKTTGDLFVPAHVEYYNESVCLKFVLVKYVSGGGLNG